MHHFMLCTETNKHTVCKSTSPELFHLVPTVNKTHCLAFRGGHKVCCGEMVTVDLKRSVMHEEEAQGDAEVPGEDTRQT